MKRKLNLNELKVKSFLTTNAKDLNSFTVKGGRPANTADPNCDWESFNCTVMCETNYCSHDCVSFDIRPC